MFLPVKADFTLPHWPVLTALVCLVCFGVFLKQESDWADFSLSIDKYCAKPQSRLTQMIMTRVAEQQDAEFCGEVMFRLSRSEKEADDIAEIAAAIKILSGFDADDSRYYVTLMLTDELQYFRSIVKDDPGNNYAYNTASWNPWRMISSSFAHGDWGHILFNLIFFIAFAATVEALIGPVAFVLFILINSMIIGVTDSVVSMLADAHHWTLGLSAPRPEARCRGAFASSRRPVLVCVLHKNFECSDRRLRYRDCPVPARGDC